MEFEHLIYDRHKSTYKEFVEIHDLKNTKHTSDHNLLIRLGLLTLPKIIILDSNISKVILLDFSLDAITEVLKYTNNRDL